jgi:hypothetical protein
MAENRIGHDIELIGFLGGSAHTLRVRKQSCLA